MGGAFSTEAAVAVVVVASAATVAYTQFSPDTSSASDPTSSSSSAAAKKKAGKKKKAALDADERALADALKEKERLAAVKPDPVVVPFPSVIPGDFEATSAGASDAGAAESAEKKKAKKGKKSKKASTQPDAPAPASSSSLVAPKASGKLKAEADNEKGESWTRVDSRKRSAANHPKKEPSSLSESQASVRSAADLGASDAGITTTSLSVTGASTPTTERTDEDEQEGQAAVPEERRRTLAEKMLPKPRKTGVDDMLETPDYPTVARVMRVQPRADEQPAAGFSWADYEDVRLGEEADGEDDNDGWGVVKSRTQKRPNRTESSEAPALSSSQTGAPTKKQRQNAARREAQKAAKAEEDQQRRDTAARHKRELDSARLKEQLKSSGGGKLSGGMNASVTENGKFVWD